MLGQSAMEKKNRGRSLYWGAAWGLAESTLGFVLHVLRVPGLAGMLMIPIGAFFIFRAYRETDRPEAALAAAAVAAVLKLSGLLLPGDPVMTLRPAAAILGEGLIAAALLVLRPEPARRKA